jgi:hypothetical protein
MSFIIFAAFLGFFGLCTELVFTGVPNKKHVGHVSLYMLPLYAVLLSVAFPFVMDLIITRTIWVREIIYAVLIMVVEGLSGLFIHKILKRDVWTYRGRGFFRYTNLKMIPWWGFWGILVEWFILYLRRKGI